MGFKQNAEADVRSNDRTGRQYTKPYAYWEYRYSYGLIQRENYAERPFMGLDA